MSCFSFIKRFVARLPAGCQLALKRRLYARQIRRGTFATDEPEFLRLAEWVREGDWVLDIGANVGHYTKRLSELAGARGRVIAFEPTPATFSLLAANALLFTHPNVTLLNAAASDGTRIAGLHVPKFASGLDNFYETQLTSAVGSDLPALTLAVDSLALDHPIALIKVDAEGHEASVLAGMEKTIAKHQPVLIVETGDPGVVARMESRGYTQQKLPGSPNILFLPQVE
ncbi:MAG: FkbM family methyltransferase [Lentisphaerae bacterium]|jgi:FkbM family methyltransferase|nr:FkbM family methyltransferase [Lentisphaerota bacterium]